MESVVIGDEVSSWNSVLSIWNCWSLKWMVIEVVQSSTTSDSGKVDSCRSVPTRNGMWIEWDSGRFHRREWSLYEMGIETVAS